MIIDWFQVQGYISGVGVIINYSVTIPIPVPGGGGGPKIRRRRFDIIKDDEEVILLVAKAFVRIMN